MSENTSIKILCVDDEKNVLRALTRLFLDDDYEIFSALSGEEGLEILDQESDVHIVLSDYRMPGMNGVDFLREVCLRYPETIRIVLSGYADTSAVVAAINEGQIYKFIPKPWDDNELRETIQNALELHRLQEKNRQLMRELQDSNEELRLLNDNLEKLVEERSAKLIMQDTALAIARNVLHSLSLAVIGLDRDALIVYCNDKGEEMFNPSGENFLLCNDRREVLPAQLNAFIDRLETAEGLRATLQIDGREAWVKGAQIDHPDQQGIVLALDWMIPTP